MQQLQTECRMQDMSIWLLMIVAIDRVSVGNKIPDPAKFPPNSYTYKIDGNYSIIDLWKHKNIGTTKDNFKAVIGSHELILLRLKKN
jgi:hypothetical protein